MIFAIGVVVDPTEILSGLIKYFSESLRISLGKVAENNSVCLFFGTVCNIWFIWGAKPWSKILSASSKATKFVLFNLKVFRFKWSFIRPGVPTINLGFLLSEFNCLTIDCPPTNCAVLIFPLPTRLFTSWNTCWASSLVGVIIKAASFLVLRRKLIIGMPNANVLPVPVWAVPRISLPAKATGIAWACIGVGVL